MAGVLTGKASVNGGTLAENVVDRCLRASGHDLCCWAHYDKAGKHSYEVGFLIPRSYGA